MAHTPTATPGHPDLHHAGSIARLALALTAWTERWVPDAFVFALILVAAVGLGGLIAAPFVPRLAERPRLVVPFVLANLLGAIPLMLLSLPRTVPGAVAILLVEGCGVIAYEVLQIGRAHV